MLRKPPQLVYRYRPVEYESSGAPTKQSVSRLLDLLRGDYWLAAPRDFNDPFDCRFEIAFPNDEMERRQLARLLHGYQSAATLPYLTTIFHAAQLEQAMSPHVTGMIDRVISGFGLCCFSQAPTSTLMWSHYASQHAGVCLKIETNGFPYIHEVQYQSQPPKLDLLASLQRVSVREQVHRLLTTKAKHWEYEQECRVIISEGSPPQIVGPGPRHLPISVTGVIFGATMPDKCRRIIADECARVVKPLEMYEAKLPYGSYEMHIEKLAT